MAYFVREPNATRANSVLKGRITLINGNMSQRIQLLVKS